MYWNTIHINSIQFNCFAGLLSLVVLLNWFLFIGKLQIKDNINELFVLAHIHDAVDLEEQALSFALDNPGSLDDDPKLAE